MKDWKAKVFLVLLSVLISFGIAEFAFRKMIFGKDPRWERLRQARDYSSNLSDDYWKLEYQFHQFQYPPTKNPHPLLNWLGAFQRNSLRHWNFIELGNRRPVLLFGDSFAQGVRDHRPISPDSFLVLFNSSRHQEFPILPRNAAGP